MVHGGSGETPPWFPDQSVLAGASDQCENFGRVAGETREVDYVTIRGTPEVPAVAGRNEHLCAVFVNTRILLPGVILGRWHAPLSRPVGRVFGRVGSHVLSITGRVGAFASVVVDGSIRGAIVVVVPICLWANGCGILGKQPRVAGRMPTSGIFASGDRHGQGHEENDSRHAAPPGEGNCVGCFEHP